jgi:hypothetical protein
VTAVPPPELAADERASIGASIRDLADGARLWSVLTVGQRARLLGRLHATVAAAAPLWAHVAAESKQLGRQHPLRGEEWQTGPWTTLGAIDAARRTLEAIAAHRSPLQGVELDEAPGGRLRAHVFPAEPIDRVLFSGFHGEVWFEPGMRRREAVAGAGLGQLDPTTSGGVGLVLGAGNVTSIPVLDVLYELLSANRVSLLKVNPTQDALVPVFERALAPLIEAGFLRIVTGGADIGAYLTQHKAFSHVHITGSAATFDAIVWGEDAERRHAADDPVLQTPITAELGGVSPIIVVPGEWGQADLDFQAEHVVTMRLQNSGHNCISGQVVLVSADWPQREAFLAAIRRAYDAAPARPVWYPRSDERLAAASADHPDAAWYGDGTRALVDLAPGDPVESTEYFAPVLGVVTLPGTGQEFLDAAVAHANDRLTGTLGANVLIDPETQAGLGEGFERAIADLRYGGIAVNAWTGVAFTVPQLPWGAFPGGTLQDVGSGIGVVHNSLLLPGVERSVLYGPFRPFPRGAASVARRRRGFSLLPKPPWFVTSRTSAAVAEGLTRYRMDGNPLRLAAALLRAYGA